MSQFFRGFFLVLGFTAASVGQAVEMVAFDSSQTNEIGEQVLEMRFRHLGRPLLHFKIPSSAYSQSKWAEQGRLELSWVNCRTQEMLSGTGELNQCIRRAFLSKFGEGDRVLPGQLKLARLQNGKIAVWLTQEGSPDISFVVSESKGLRSVAVATPLARSVFPIAPIPRKAKPAPQPELTTVEMDSSQRVGFVFFGDSGTGQKAQFEVAAGVKNFCLASLCQFVALLGDNFYGNGVSDVDDSQFDTKFEKPYGPLGLTFYPALGNHDHHGNIQAQIDYSAYSNFWKMPGRYYSYQYGPVEFFVIDSDDYDGAQRSWLEKGLHNSKAKWKVIYGHHPVYSYGSHGDTWHLVRHLQPALKTYDVDFFLAGHDHDKQVIERDGITYVVSGAAAKLRSVKKGKYSQFASSTYGFSHFLIEGETATLSMLDDKGAVQYRTSYRKRNLP